MKHLYFILVMFALCVGSALAQEYQPLLEEGKIWVVDNDVAGGDVYHIYNQYTANKERVIDCIQYWALMESKFVDGAFGDPKAISDCFVGEKDGKLYFWNGGEQQAPVLFMDFSLTAGSSLDFKLSDDEDFGTVYMEVTAVGDTVFASSADRSRRRLLHVSYNGRPDVWVEGIGSLKYGIMFPYYFGTTGSVQSLWECRDGETILYTASGNPDGISSQSLANCRSSHIFDLQGRRLTAEPQHGVFIKGGKKVAKSIKASVVLKRKD